MASETQPSGVYAYFSEPAWEPFCAVGSHANGRANAQVCISIANASIVPDRPRLIVMLWKANYTHELVQQSGSMAITVLTDLDVPLVEPLGIRSGRDGDKLEGTGYRLTEAGNPYFPNGTGYVECTVIDALDLGDATAFLCAIEHEQQLRRAQPITWRQASELADDEVMQRYQQKLERDRANSSRVMRWA